MNSGVRKQGGERRKSTPGKGTDERLGEEAREADRSRKRTRVKEVGYRKRG